MLRSMRPTHLIWQEDGPLSKMPELARLARVRCHLECWDKRVLLQEADEKNVLLRCAS